MQIHLIPDRTAFVQLAIFLAVFFGLTALIFKPVIKIIKLRRERSSGLLDEARDLQKNIDTKLSEYEKKMNLAKTSILAEYSEMRARSLEEESKIKNEAREESLRMFDKARQDLLDTKKKVVEELRKEVPSITKEIIAKVKEI